MPDYVAFSTRFFYLRWAGAGATSGRTRPSHCVGPSLSCRGHGTLQVSHLFPVELTYAKIGNSLLLERVIVPCYPSLQTVDLSKAILVHFLASF